jgi:predicted nucleic acid-binding protein
MAGSPAPGFIDTNVLVYLCSGDAAKADAAERIVRAGGAISVQVLNEFANVARRKMHLSWTELREVLATLRRLLTVAPVSLQTHDTGLALAERYGLSIYDAMIAAAALEAGCSIVWSEDMHTGLVIEGRLRIADPFRTDQGAR